jgi:hypothetical protein
MKKVRKGTRKGARAEKQGKTMRESRKEKEGRRTWIDEGKRLDCGPAARKKVRMWKNLIHLGLVG